MKTCSTCGNSFSDDLSFCLQDGTVLTSRVTADLNDQPTELLKVVTDPDPRTDISNDRTIVDHPTAILREPSPQAPKLFQMSAVEPAGRMGCVLSIGQVAAALVVVVGLGLAGFMFLNSKNEVAMVSNNTGSGPPLSNSYGNSTANSMNTSGTPPHTSSTDGVKTISRGDITAQALVRPQPEYPPLARQNSVSGAVEVRVLIDENGNVISATATSRHVLLRPAAENAARGARFTPPRIDGVPVRVSGVITYNFVL
jgi:TonB family protein